MNKKKLLTIIASLALIIGVGFYSLAYFTDEKEAVNVITTGNIAIELHDLGADGEDFPQDDGITGVVPGDKIVKIVKVENVGSNPAWVRVKLTPASEPTDLDSTKIVLELNTTNWTKKGDYYYYNTVLEPNATTENLLSSVTFPTTLGNEYANAKFTFGVIAYGVQSQNNGTSAEGASW